jgi:uncharacterized repeat protein (TIGR01451 family)
MVKDIYPGQNGSRPDYLTNYDGELFFYADDGSHGRELWKSDGTLDGTTLVKDIRPGDKGKHSLGSPYHLGPIYHGYLYFEANTDDALQLWRTDGTSAGTTYVMDLAPETDSISYSLGEVIHLNNLLYIHRYVADQYGVWASDDAGSSTLIATDLTPYWSMDQTDPNNFIGNQYLFQGYTSNNGYELWAIPVTTLSALNLSLVSKNTIDSGSLITYTISFSNTGATTASNVILTDTLSTKITPLHFDTSGVNMTLIGESPYCWAISDLSPGDKGTIVITAIPNAGLHVGELITNTAQISASMSDGIAWKSRRAKQAVIVFAYRNYIPMILR